MKLLPFLKNNHHPQHSPGPDDKVDTAVRESDEPGLLETVMKELFEARTDKERAEAFRAAFELLEQEPHEEIEHGELSDIE